MITSSKFFKKTLFVKDQDNDWARQDEQEKSLSKKKNKSTQNKQKTLNRQYRRMEIEDLHKNEQQKKDFHIVLPKLLEINHSYDPSKILKNFTEDDYITKTPKFFNDRVRYERHDSSIYLRKKIADLEDLITHQKQLNSLGSTPKNFSAMKNKYLTIQQNVNLHTKSKKSNLKMSGPCTKSIDKQIKLKYEQLINAKFYFKNKADNDHLKNSQVLIFRKLHNNNKLFL